MYTRVRVLNFLVSLTHHYVHAITVTMSSLDFRGQSASLCETTTEGSFRKRVERRFLKIMLKV